jgi:pimeloyl-ACP methyl ester carboxylesterase
VAALRAAAPLIISGLGSASQRWLCYILDQPGCGRSGVSEDHGNDKAGQEYAAAIQPLSDIYMQAAQKQVVFPTSPDRSSRRVD